MVFLGGCNIYSAACACNYGYDRNQGPDWIIRTNLTNRKHCTYECGIRIIGLSSSFLILKILSQLTSNILSWSPRHLTSYQFRKLSKFHSPTPHLSLHIHRLFPLLESQADPKCTVSQGCRCLILRAAT